MLTQWGLDKAAEKHQDVWMIASKDGKGLYESLGFVLVATGSRCGEPQYVLTKFEKHSGATFI
jgi:hypothetical protein